MSLRCATIDLRKEAMKFSPGLLRAGADGAPHLTGANVFMRLAAQVSVAENGMGPDYNHLKRAATRCAACWDEKLLIADRDAAFDWARKGDGVEIRRAGSSALLLAVPARDVHVLEHATSTSLPELAHLMAAAVARAAEEAGITRGPERVVRFALALQSARESGWAAWPGAAAGEAVWAALGEDGPREAVA